MQNSSLKVIVIYDQPLNVLPVFEIFQNCCIIVHQLFQLFRTEIKRQLLLTLTSGRSSNTPLSVIIQPQISALRQKPITNYLFSTLRTRYRPNPAFGSCKGLPFLPKHHHSQLRACLQAHSTDQNQYWVHIWHQMMFTLKDTRTYWWGEDRSRNFF